MKTKLFALATAAILTGCQPFGGNLQVFQPTKMVLKKTIFGNQKKTTLSPGRYSARLTFKSERKARLIIEGSKKYKVDIKVPRGDELPRYHGNISFSGSEIGQPWDIKGFVDSETTYSGNMYATESCTYTVRQRVCRIVKDGREGHGYSTERRHGDRDGRRGDRRGGDRDGRRECRMEYVTVQGRQRVEFHYRYVNSDIKLKLIAPQTGEKLASFNGDRRESDKIYTYRGSCR